MGKKCASEDHDAYVREAAVLAIGKLARRGDSQAVMLLTERLTQDQDTGVRAASALAIGKVATKGDSGAIEALTQLLSDEDSSVSAMASSTLNRLGDQVDADEDQCVVA